MGGRLENILSLSSRKLVKRHVLYLSKAIDIKDSSGSHHKLFYDIQ